MQLRTRVRSSEFVVQSSRRDRDVCDAESRCCGRPRMRGCASGRCARRSCAARSRSSCRASGSRTRSRPRRNCKPQGLNTILTRLGENLTRIEEAQEVFDHYLKVIDLVKASGLDAQISIKPTQLGYDQNPEVCYGYCIQLLERCEAAGIFFWLDMESSPYVDGTIRAVQALACEIRQGRHRAAGLPVPHGRRTSRNSCRWVRRSGS